MRTQVGATALFQGCLCRYQLVPCVLFHAASPAPPHPGSHHIAYPNLLACSSDSLQHASQLTAILHLLPHPASSTCSPPLPACSCGGHAECLPTDERGSAPAGNDAASRPAVVAAVRDPGPEPGRQVMLRWLCCTVLCFAVLCNVCTMEATQQRTGFMAFSFLVGISY